MNIITDNKRLPRNALWALATMGWAVVIYLCWVVLMDSIERAGFSVAAIQGQIPAEIDPFIDRYTAHPWQALAHTATGVVFAVLGPLQFVAPLRRRFPLAHRISGRIFLPTAIACGIAAVTMAWSFPVWGSSRNLFMSLASSALMVFAFVQAYRMARRREFILHREWMIRGFALGLAVAFFRVLLNDILPGLGYADFNVRWEIVMVISWPVMLLAAEMWIRATRPARPRTSNPKVPVAA